MIRPAAYAEWSANQMAHALGVRISLDGPETNRKIRVPALWGDECFSMSWSEGFTLWDRLAEVCAARGIDPLVPPQNPPPALRDGKEPA